jgi:cysteine desulfurase/selenocysteine lyase
VPTRFEAGTPNITGVIGFEACVTYLESLTPGGLDQTFAEIGAWEHELLAYATPRLKDIPGLRLTGTAPDKAAILAFTLEGAHPHDIGTILDSRGVAIRAGHHCCQPLMRRLSVPATARASLAFYNTFEDIDRLVAAVRHVQEVLR